MMGGMSQCRVIALCCVLVLTDHGPFCWGASWIVPLHQWFERRHHHRGDHHSPPPQTDRSHPSTTPKLSSPRSSRFPSMTTSLSLQPDRSSSNFFATRTFYRNDTMTRTDQSQDLLPTTLPSPMGKVNDYLNTLSRRHDLTRTTGTTITNENHILLMAEEELDLVTVRPPQMTTGTWTATSGLPDNHSNDDDYDDGDDDDDDDAIKSTTAVTINSHGGNNNNGMFHQPRISNVRKIRDDSNATTGVPQRDQQQRWFHDASFAVESTLPPYLSLEPVGSTVSLLEPTSAEDWDKLSHSIQGVLTASFVSSMYQYICSDPSTILNDDLHTMIIFMQPFVLTYLSTTQSMIGQTLRMLGDVTNLWTTAIVQQVFDNDTAAYNPPMTKNPVWNKIQNTFKDIPTRTWQWWSDLTNNDISSSPSTTAKRIPLPTNDATSNDFFFASVQDTTVKQPHPPIHRPSTESILRFETNRVTDDDEIDIDRLLQLAQEMQQELPYRGLNVVSEADFVPDQFCELEGKLREAQASLEQKGDTIDDLKERLEQSTSRDIASTKVHEREVQRLRREIKALQDRFAAECGKRKAVVARLQDNLKEKSNVVSKLEGMLSIASTRGESMDQRMKEAEEAFRKTKAELLAERTRHVSAEEQTRVDLAVLKDKLRASEARLQEKRATIEELEDQLRSIVDKSATTNKELQNDVDQLRTEMKTLNDQLDHDRAELSTKNESLKQQQKMLQQNAEEIVSLQQSIAASTRSDEQRNRDMSQLNASLDQAVADLEAERIETNTTVTRLQDQLVQTESKLHNVEATLQETRDLLAEQQGQLRVLANNSSTSEKEYQNQLECLQRTTEEQLAKLNVVVQTKEVQIDELQSRVAALLETSSRLNELEAQLSNATTAERNMKLELDSVRSELSTTMQSFEAQQSNRSITERQLNARIGELEEKLRASSLDLEQKQAAICDLEENAKRAADESMASIEQLTTEINSLQSEMKISNDLLQKERASMAAKVEECEQLRFVVEEQIKAEAARLDALIKAEKEAKLAEEERRVALAEAEKEAKLAEERKIAQALAEAEREAKLAEERKIAQALAEAGKEAKLAEERKIAQALAEAGKEAKLAEERKIAQALAEAGKDAKLAEERKIAQALAEAGKEAKLVEERKIAQALAEAEKEAKLAEERKIADGFRLAAIAKTEEERILLEQARRLMEERNVEPQPPAVENTLTEADAPDAILEPDTWSQPLRFAPQKQQPSWVRKTEWWE